MELDLEKVYFASVSGGKDSLYMLAHILHNLDIYPLMELGVFEDTIWEWARNQPLFNNYYKYNRRCGCMYCPMQSLSNTKYLCVYYPEFYEKMITMSKETEALLETKLGRPFSVWSSNSKYNTYYREKRIKDIELKELDKF